MIFPRARCILLLTVCPALAATGSEASVNHWTPAGPTAPTVTALAFDPLVPDLIYAGTLGEGIYLSEDGGARWRPARLQGPVPLQVLTLFAHPELPLIIAGTIEGFYVSLNRGRNWIRLGDQDSIWDIVADPDDAHRLYAASGFGGVLRSTDGGATWKATGRPRSTVYGLAAGRGVLFAGSGAGIYRSFDRGDTWKEVADYAVTELAYDASTGTVYAATFEQGFFLSRDGGETWIRRDRGLPRSPGFAMAIGPDALYLGTLQGLWTTRDEGVNWSRFPIDGSLGDRVFDVRVDPHFPGRIFWGTELDGVWTSDAGVGVSTGNAGFRGRPEVLDIAVDPGSPSTLYLGAEHGRLFRSEDAGESWTSLAFPERAHVFRLVVDPTSPSVLYAVAGSVWRSPDRGETWVDTGLGGRDFAVFGLTADPSTPGSIYAATAVGVWKSSDRGVTWSPSNEGLDSANERGDAGIYALLVHPETPSTFYAGTATGLFVSTDSGATWSRLGSGFPRPPWIRALALDPRRPEVLYAAVTFAAGGGGVWRSADAGASWTATALGAFAHRLAAVPHPGPESSTVYALGIRGAFVSYDGGDRWSEFRAGLGPAGRVDALAADPESSSVLYAATNEGLFTTRGVAPTPVLELHDGRFRVEVGWRDFEDRTGRGQVAVVPSPVDGPTPLSGQGSAVLRFFSPDNWEALVKVLDGRAVNGHFWVLSAAATNVDHAIEVFDTACGETRLYRDRGGDGASAVVDTAAFRECSHPLRPRCLADPETLCLGDDGRFRVRAHWQTPLDVLARPARRVSLPEPGRARSADSGIFTFFGEDNWELLVKVLDACALNGHYWVFTAAATNVGYTVRVTDTATGAVKTYSNPLGVVSDAFTDSMAFANCPPAESAPR